MTAQSIVRIARAEDKVEVWRLFMLGHEENAKFTLSKEKVNFFLDRALAPELIHPQDTGPRGAIGVIGEPGSLEGLAFLIFSNYWYTTDRHLEEMLVYVDPAHRKSRHAVSLINWMKLQSDLTGIPLITGIVSSKRTEAKCDLYGRLLPKVGEFFMYGGKGSIHGSSAAYA